MNIDHGDNSCGIAADFAGFSACSAACSETASDVDAGGADTAGDAGAVATGDAGAAVAGDACTDSEAAGGAAAGDGDAACTGEEGPVLC